MDSDEFDRPMQAEFERQEAGRRCGGYSVTILTA